MPSRFTQYGGAQGAEMALREMVAQRIAAEMEQRKRQVEEYKLGQQDRQIDQGDTRNDLTSRGLDLEAERLHKPAEPKGPMTLSPGASMVDPSTGRIIATAPSQEKPAGPMNLGPGAVIADPTTGRIIVRNPQQAARSPEEDLRTFEAKEQIKAKYGGTRPSLGVEKSARAFFTRMLEAEKNARSVEDKITGTDVMVQQHAPKWLETWLQTPEGQMYQQAQRTFTEARLRKESGAAIANTEYDNDRTTNFRVPGESKELTAQKRRSRLTTLRGLGGSAGRALQEYYGDVSLDDLLKEFEAPVAAAPQGGGVTIKSIRQVR